MYIYIYILIFVYIPHIVNKLPAQRAQRSVTIYVFHVCVYIYINVCVIYISISAAARLNVQTWTFSALEKKFTKSAKALFLCFVISCKASRMPFMVSSVKSSMFFSHLALVVTKDWWTLLREQTHLDALPTSFFQAATLSLAAFRAAFAASSSLPHLAALFPGSFATAASPSLGILQTSSSSIGMAVVAVVAAVAVVVLSRCTDFPFTTFAFFKAYSFSANSFSTLPRTSSSSMTSFGAAQVSPHTYRFQEGMTMLHSIFSSGHTTACYSSVVGKMYPMIYQAGTPLHAI